MKLPALPEHLENIRRLVEDLAGRPIEFLQRIDLPGDMAAELEGGVPRILYREVWSEPGIAEELLHLELRVTGFPSIAPPWNNHLTEQAATMLQNCVEHELIFPRLEAWEHDPRKDEKEAVEVQLRSLESRVLEVQSRLAADSQLAALIVMMFVRAQLSSVPIEAFPALAEIRESTRQLTAMMARKIISIATVEAATRTNLMEELVATLGLEGTELVSTSHDL